MSNITIQCRLITNESTRQMLWQLMAERNTPLVNELLEQVGQHPKFDAWRQSGRLPTHVVREFCKVLKVDSRFIGQPARFYESAIRVVDYIYKSWLAIQRKLQRKLEGKIRWLEMLKSDIELAENCDRDLEAIRTKATEILSQITTASVKSNTQQKGSKNKKTKKNTVSEGNRSISSILFDQYAEYEDSFSKCAIAYLLKNGCKVNSNEEDPDKFKKRHNVLKNQVKRLTEQLIARMPKGRDLTGQSWFETLITAATTAPENEEEASSWQANLLRKSIAVPFPITFETNEDMSWSVNQKGKLCVRFNGLSECSFEVYCDKRQIHWFKRFLEDQQIKRDSKDQFSSALFTLRSGRLAWQENEDKGDPWTVHRLTLFCTIDTRLWSAEGTEQVRQEKATEIVKTITQTEAKGSLNKNQESFIKRKKSTLARINNPFPRPHKLIYAGQPHISVGVSLGLKQPATVAVVDVNTGKVLIYRSIRQLLGDDYNLLHRQRYQQRTSAHQRHKAQKTFTFSQSNQAELGQHVDRLIAKAVLAIAQEFKASSIVLPKLGDVREIVQTEIQTRAEEKIPGCVEVQKKYAKQFRVNIHQWSYSRLIQSIQSQAVKIGIAIEEGQQPARGSPQEKARELAIAAYQSRHLVQVN
ncbi:MAG: hypothetical protein DCF19_08735 [Pseudanabaena frigida]|uniref:Uncharacterized protein n=1 Tax=Pseudanabaena frigida TaxID=945775 RepID=A0A2W4Y385_9CYAN|nr:MAG: hypothetical protein DCF19_08735 [Pseudanabaena frigida]